MFRSICLMGGFAAGIMLSAASAKAAFVLVPANADIYNASNPGSLDGANPPFIDVTGLSSISFFVPIFDRITLNGGTFNDADGVGAAVSSSTNTGANFISGVASAPNAGFLTGVFLGSSVSMTTPPALSYTTTDFTSSSPLLQQAFFIGDGFTGDGTGAVQTFFVPTGATRLFFGISDAPGYNGSPGAYGDNFGSFGVYTMGAGTTPAGAPAPLAGAGLLSFFGAGGIAIRRRFRRLLGSLLHRSALPA